MALIDKLIASARRATRQRPLAANDGPGSATISRTDERDTVQAHVESRQWLEQAIQRSQSAEVRRFLGMISSSVEDRIHALDAERALQTSTRSSCPGPRSGNCISSIA